VQRGQRACGVILKTVHSCGPAQVMLFRRSSRPYLAPTLPTDSSIEELKLYNVVTAPAEVISKTVPRLLAPPPYVVP